MGFKTWLIRKGGPGQFARQAAEVYRQLEPSLETLETTEKIAALESAIGVEGYNGMDAACSVLYSMSVVGGVNTAAFQGEEREQILKVIAEELRKGGVPDELNGYSNWS